MNIYQKLFKFNLFIFLNINLSLSAESITSLSEEVKYTQTGGSIRTLNPYALAESAPKRRRREDNEWFKVTCYEYSFRAGAHEMINNSRALQSIMHREKSYVRFFIHSNFIQEMYDGYYIKMDFFNKKMKKLPSKMFTSSIIPIFQPGNPSTIDSSAPESNGPSLIGYTYKRSDGDFWLWVDYPPVQIVPTFYLPVLIPYKS